MEAVSTHYDEPVRSRAARSFAVYHTSPGPMVRPATANEASNNRQQGVTKASHVGRAFDIVIALLAIIIFLPFLALATLAIKLSAPGPVLFVQPRIGRDGKPFPCLKFRSMVLRRSWPICWKPHPKRESNGIVTRNCATIRASLRWVVSCARAASTNCPSCSTYSSAR
jgi:lipopolysaccharide/colanic/teichoic acid biosynthesis glycosyltransferase